MYLFFFFQAEDGIRDGTVTGVQTCALPISRDPRDLVRGSRAPGARDERLHDPHAGTRGARYVLARAGGAVHRPGVAGDGGQPRGLLQARPSSGGRPRPLSYARRGYPPFGPGPRRVAPPWGRVPPHLGPAVARP